MNRPRIFIALAVLAVMLAATGGGYLYAELDRTTTTLRSTTATLRETTETLRTTETHLGTTREHLEDRTATLQETNGVLAQRSADLAAERSVSNQLQQDKTALTGSLDTATAENTTLTVDLATAEGAKRQLQGELSTATARVESLRTEKMDVEERHRALEGAAGTVTNLEGRVKDLQEELDALRSQRRPLILAKDREESSGFKCTGSMEPVVTCLDTATWALPLGPEDIVVGATISFPHSACWPDETNTAFTVHRVTDIRVIGGVTHYWPKGDANSKADGCWVPHTAVDGYIIAIHRNTRLENTELRDKVNAADTRYASARAARVAAWATYLAERDAYVALRVRHGCPGDVTATCYADGAALAELVQAFKSYRRVVDVYRNAVGVEERAASIYECWYDNARESLYPGHIPNLCTRVVPLPPPPPPLR